MSWDLEPVRAAVERRDGQMAEFVALPEEVREAALEYARGLMIGREPEPLPEGEDVQFMLVGVEQGGRSILFFSSAVTEAKFARGVEGFDRVPIRPGGPVARVPRMTAVVGAKMTSFEQIVGADYRDALQTLLSEWNRRAAASEQRRGIGPGETP